MAQLDIGDKAPAFNLEDQLGNKVSLQDFKGKKLLVYFYPRADTPGCTRQACSIRDAQDVMGGADMAAVGISPDKPEKQKKFTDKYELNFALLSDVDHQVARAYGAWGTKKNYGKEYEGIIRSSFLIDEKGKIAQANYKVKPENTVPLALEAAEK
jgi:thioredoxin-dependent peroxiredoxin